MNLDPLVLLEALTPTLLLIAAVTLAGVSVFAASVFGLLRFGLRARERRRGPAGRGDLSSFTWTSTED
ncbi:MULTISPECIES: hypothetical protein [unclassified Streptomyces]|uniref:hypothetical protein n=1 Tax=unclassified Streptomyces TaxID=2593676 RepID=UPI001BEBFCE3|nr:MULTISPECIES: hypothetical protein [unclassified Streptomyces]MBT2407388.1 hypothetical protein [Streptomyces sp. ISL-21]MBT2611067.1 hypothetical protein [Streptomyces sp. ISL-87]